MHVLVVGAGGFVGRAVVDRLVGGRLGPLDSLTLLDLRCPPRVGAARMVEGSYADDAVRSAAFAQPVDLLIHLASLAGGAAEQDFARGRSANLDGTLALFDAAAASGRVPRVVFTSSIAALDMSAKRVSADQPLRPNGSYGTHKAMAELYLADLTRRGELDGRSIRPSGVVARAPDSYAGFATAWMSDIFRAVREGRELEVPASAESVVWLQSVGQTADNVLHAAGMPAEGLPAHRAWTLPTTADTVGAFVAAAAAHTGKPSRIRYGAARLGLPELDDRDARAAGFGREADTATLVANVMQQLEGEAS